MPWINSAEAARGRELDWLPATLPPNVKFVLSCATPSRPAFDARGRERALPLIEVGPLTTAERLGILRDVPLLSAKSLDHEQLDLLLANPATANPLFLLVALEELRGFGSFEQLNERIAALPHDGDTVAAIFAQVIERLEIEFDVEVVAYAPAPGGFSAFRIVGKGDRRSCFATTGHGSTFSCT